MDTAVIDSRAVLRLPARNILLKYPSLYATDAGMGFEITRRG